jgi:translocation and assembly module TamB
MDLVAQARGLRVSARVDRRLVISGQLKANLDGDQLALRGTLTADQALFILPEDNAPQLSDDVRVRQPGAPAVAAAPAKGSVVLGIRPDVFLTLDLGQDFQVRGRGLNTRVAGSVTLRNAGERSLTPLLRGELRTVQGSYKAYGQQLDIEAGVLRFSGPYDNPALDILAIRPNLPQRVGVQITGTAIAPVVRLYAEPELPEAEKLAWLVLGRSAGTGGAETAVLQQAALALLGGSGRGLPGSLGQALGLDEELLRRAAHLQRSMYHI